MLQGADQARNAEADAGPLQDVGNMQFAGTLIVTLALWR